MENTAATTRHVAMLPTPGMGHLIPLVQFAKKLHLFHGFSVTLMLPNTGPLSTMQMSFLSMLPSGIDYIILPSVSLEDLPQTVKVEIRVLTTITRSLPAIRDAVESCGRKFLAFVADMFAVDALDVAKEFNIPAYLFFPSAATTLSVFLHLPKLDKTVSCEFRDVPGKMKIPGCIPIRGEDLFHPLQDRKDEAYRAMLRCGTKFATVDGIIGNTFKDLEPVAFEALQQKESGFPAFYPIGPLIQTDANSEDFTSDDASLKWLDEQPSNSVLFIAFGSGGTLSHAQIIELAMGLELSEQRFLWVMRCPRDKTQNLDDPLAYLPENFLNRTKNLGRALPLWAPQAQILAHPSTGSFLTHCGWNSTLESVVNGVPLIAWPLHAEQKVNAVLLNEGVKVALRPMPGSDGLVGRVEICNMVKNLMEGEEGKGIRSRMKGLKEAAAAALGEDGVSTSLLSKLAGEWITAEQGRRHKIDTAV